MARNAAYNAAVTERVLGGENGPVRDSVLLNAAGAIVADGQVEGARATDRNILTRARHALEIAGEAVDSGRAWQLLCRWRELSQSYRDLEERDL